MNLPLFEQPWPDGDFRFFQLGFVVDDLLDAAARWARAFGIGPFHILPRAQNTCRYRGADAVIDLQVGVAQAGPVQIELIQNHTTGPSVFADMAAITGRSGFHQAATLTADYEAKVAQFVGQGYDIACELTAPGQRIAFVDTVEDFGFFTEVVEETPSFRANLARIAATCAAWDGADPIRILGRRK
ncbi:VOC family protein [[Mycobacterium] wendilense]|uniref:VOC family protein n=1 Tax=[Mycobacterium] wendilense TaxID=3064284 RepID=A0ABM9MK86_9MYCO|nr:VOC family protein [Mycolicibacterium sp. MU0050]CAJ1587289.1 VOC family protein [Mycolicibacterium sp. MU0050]